MCKIVLRGPHPPPRGKNALEDLQFAQPGDFVEAVSDNHIFGTDEKPPLFVIISVPDMTVSEAKTLCAYGKHITNAAGEVLKFAPRQALSLDLTKISDIMTREQVLAGIRHNAHVDNPAIIGSSPNEIG
jgi:hypothetical protein